MMGHLILFCIIISILFVSYKS